MRAAVVIPVYKEIMTYCERISLKQCIRILKNYDIIFVTYEGMDLRRYISFLDGVPHQVRFFSSSFFETIYGYNKLMLSVNFYQRFVSYDYILIYQLDTFVFRDELNEWCKRDFDYIGAPWFEGHSVGGEDNKLWKVGNGGFSLRKVSSFINCLESKIAFPSYFDLTKSYRAMPSQLKFKKLGFIFRWFLGFGNTIKDFVQNIEINEDTFWGILVPRYIKTFRIPDPSTASYFSVESNPRLLYELNGKVLPFGCHAWEKYDFNFWKSHIEMYGYKFNREE